MTTRLVRRMKASIVMIASSRTLKTKRIGGQKATNEKVGTPYKAIMTRNNR